MQGIKNEEEFKFYNEHVLGRFISLLERQFGLDKKEASLRAQRLFDVLSAWAKENSIDTAFFNSRPPYQKTVIIAHFVDEKIKMPEQEKIRFVGLLVDCLELLKNKPPINGISEMPSQQVGENIVQKGREEKKAQKIDIQNDLKNEFYSILKLRLEGDGAKTDEEAKVITEEFDGWIRTRGITFEWIKKRPFHEIKNIVNAFLNHAYPFGMIDAREREEYAEIIGNAINCLRKQTEKQTGKPETTFSAVGNKIENNNEQPKKIKN